jgi:hypothetical protein
LQLVLLYRRSQAFEELEIVVLRHERCHLITDQTRTTHCWAVAKATR